ncbi:MAG: aminodeoxychorismate/anthranilate synthase component II [Planctomycetota bacterium]
MILLLDNYDSFTYNLYQSLAASGAQVEVVRNDRITVEEVLAKGVSGIVLSPGPGRPQSAGICLDLIRALPADMPLLGVCLGHQALVEALGGKLELDPIPTHGKPAMVHVLEQAPLFQGLPNPFQAGRYHSLRAVREELPAELELCAWTEEGLVMAVQHRERPWFGVQFHPESILTPQGDRILEKFLQTAGEVVSR